MLGGALSSAAAWLIGSKAGRIVLALLIVASLGALLYWRGIDAGVEKRRQKEAERAARQAEERREIEDEIDGTDPDRVRDELRDDWLR